MNVDFTGSDPVSRWGINVPIIYTKAYACYAMKCVIAPDIPNNWASLAPFTISSPVNILNAQRPAPVSLRHVFGHMVPDLVLGALAQALPGQILAEGAGALWNIHISAKPLPGAEGAHGRDPDVQLGRDGRAACAGWAVGHGISVRRDDHADRGDQAGSAPSSSGARNCGPIPRATANIAGAWARSSKSRRQMATSSISRPCSTASPMHPARPRWRAGRQARIGHAGRWHKDAPEGLASMCRRAAGWCWNCPAVAVMATPRAVIRRRVSTIFQRVTSRRAGNDLCRDATSLW